jgi:hypothetical protein
MAIIQTTTDTGLITTTDAIHIPTVAAIDDIEDSSSMAKFTLVLPEYLNVVLLVGAIYGMYQGIEIKVDQPVF